MGRFNRVMSTIETAGLAVFLEGERQPILAAAGEALGRAGMRHYEQAGEEAIHERLAALFDRLVAALESRDLTPLVAYAEEVADDRYEAGYDLVEVQVAFNALEEAIWARVIAGVGADRLAEAIGLVTTALGAGKDALARRYVSRATATRVASLDLRALFEGTA